MEFADCPHVRVVSKMYDQALGVECNDCNTSLGCCWMDEHCSEKLWNRVCKNDPECRPCEQDRDDHCFLCGEKFESDAVGVSK